LKFNKYCQIRFFAKCTSMPFLSVRLVVCDQLWWTDEGCSGQQVPCDQRTWVMGCE